MINAEPLHPKSAKGKEATRRLSIVLADVRSSVEARKRLAAEKAAREGGEAEPS